MKKKINLQSKLEENSFLTISSFFLIFLAVILSIIEKIVSYFGNYYKKNFSSFNNSFNNFLISSFFYMCFRLLRNLFNYLIQIKEQQLEEKILFKSKNFLIKHIKKLSTNQINNLSAAYLTNLFLQDIDYAACYFIDKIRRQKNFFEFSITTLYLIYIFITEKFANKKIIISIIIGTTILMTLAFFLFYNFVSPLQKKTVKNEISLNNFLTDRIAGFKTTKIFQQEEKQRIAFEKKNDFFLKNSQKLHFFRISFRRILAIIFELSIFTISYFFFSALEENNSFRDKQIFFFNILSPQIAIFISLFLNFFVNNLEISKKEKYLKKVNQIFATETEIINLIPRKKITKIYGKIEFKNVWFAYNEENWILKNISFIIFPKQTVAFVGTTGSGKTTIINLLLKNYNIQKGQILIDNIDIKEINQIFLRQQINQMIQDIFLFEGSIKDNITLKDKNISLKEVMKISKIIGLNKIVNKFPKKYNFQVVSQGNNFSSGEKQLISFARILARKSNLIILDEATSNIDSETENILQKAIQKTMKKNTLIVIAHRLSTIKDSDKIIVLNKGKIIEQGNHQVLMKKKEFYFNLVNSNKKDLDL